MTNLGLPPLSFDAYMGTWHIKIKEIARKLRSDPLATTTGP